MEGLYSALTLEDTHQDINRNIVSLRVSKDLFSDLSDEPEAWTAAQQLELITKPPLYTDQAPIINRPFEEAEWNEAIGYPFKHTSQSRYSDGSYGVWYGADSIETTVHETAYHWRTKLLGDAEGFDRPGVSIDRKVYLVRCDGALIDLRSRVQDFPELIHPTDYSATHAIGAKFHREGHPGLVTRSARCNGDVYALFRPGVLTNPRHACYLTYVVTPQGIEVQKSPGTTWMTI